MRKLKYHPLIIEVNLTLTYAYTEESNNISCLILKVYENSYILANDLIEELMIRGFSLDKSAVSLYDEDIKMFIYLGIIPLDILAKIQITKEKLINFHVN